MKMALEVLGRLVAVALFAFAGRAALAAPAARDGAGGLTEREGREARELAERFLERLRAADDLAPLVEEMFVADFGERLRRETGAFPMLLVAPGVLARAEPEALRRFYVAEFNYLSLLLQHYSVRQQESEESGRDDDDLTLEEIFPPGTRFARAQVEPVHDLRIDLLMVEEAGAMRLVSAFPVLGD